MGKVKVRAKMKRGMADMKCLVSHPMETGERKNTKTGKKVPAHFIQEMSIMVNGKEQIKAVLNSSVSRNPYFRFRLDAEAGDTVRLSWADNKGETGSGEARVK